MSDIISDSAKIRQSIRKIVKQVLEEETKPCFRIYKAQIKGLPNGKTCEVQIVGDENTINLPYSSSISGIAVNDMVWVATIYNSFSNAIVWQPIDFISATGGGGGDFDPTKYYTKTETDGLLNEKQDDLTQTQLNAVNSGITANKVSIYDNYANAINNKVDKETGKGLSTNDFTDAEKTKLAGIEAEAQVNVIETITAGDNITVSKSGKNVTISATGGGGSGVDVVQTTGQSMTAVMSQKAVTDELNGKASTSYVQGNPTENGTVDLAKLKVGNTVYNVPQGGGTTVVANPTVDVSDAYLIGLQVGDTKYKVFSAKDTNGFVEKNELALYYHGITAAFHRNDGTDDPIYAQICYYSKTKDIYDFGSLMDDIVNYQQGKTFICNCICNYSSSEGEVTTFIKEIFYNEETYNYCLRLTYETEAVEITTIAEVYDYRIDVIEY